MTTTCNGCWHLGEACGHCAVCSGPHPFPVCDLRSLRWAPLLWAYVALIAVLLFATPAHSALAPVITAPNITCAENGPACSLPINKSVRAKSYTQVRVETLSTGSAKPGIDFVAVNTIVTLGNNQLLAALPITVINNSTVQGDRVIPIRLTCVRFCQLTNTYVPPTIVIKDDEVAPVPPPVVIPPPVVTPPPAAVGVCADGSTPPADVSCPDQTGAPAIDDNFNLAEWYELSDPPAKSPDPQGAFRFSCLAGQLLKDDPIVYPGQPGKSHLHQFFGNTGTNASSNYQSLRTTGGSTCTQGTGTKWPGNPAPANAASASPQRTAYWMPAMLDGAGSAVKPEWTLTYYKKRPKSDPECAKVADPMNPATIYPTGGKCITTPNALKFVFGYNMTTMSGGPNDPNSRDWWAMGFDCERDQATHESVVGGPKHNLQDVVSAGTCLVGDHLRVFATFPTCWDGKNLDSADHRSHVVFAYQAYCDKDHPENIPAVAIQAYFTADANFVAGLWRLSSDDALSAMLGKPVVPGTTLHFDYWEAWSRIVKRDWTDHCLDEQLTCSGGELGNGQEIKGMVAPHPKSVLVPLTSIP